MNCNKKFVKLHNNSEENRLYLFKAGFLPIPDEVSSISSSSSLLFSTLVDETLSIEDVASARSTRSFPSYLQHLDLYKTCLSRIFR